MNKRLNIILPIIGIIIILILLKPTVVKIYCQRQSDTALWSWINSDEAAVIKQMQYEGVLDKQNLDTLQNEERQRLVNESNKRTEADKELAKNYFSNCLHKWGE